MAKGYHAAGAIGSRRPNPRVVALQRACAETLESRMLLSRNIYVDAALPGSVHDGTSWNSAYKDLQSALGVAASGDQVLVAHGTYKPTPTGDRTISFQLKSGVNIRGGYAGYGAADPGARDVGLYTTILSGGISKGSNNYGYSYHVLVASAVDSTAVLDGFVITAGNANGDTSSTTVGGGMYCVAASPTLINCTFKGNAASGSDAYGGGMYIESSSPTLTNCTFCGNSASFGGGGIASRDYSSPTMTNCVIIGNSSGSAGGGLLADRSFPVLTNCTFVANLADDGSGLYGYSSYGTVTNCIMWGNSAGQLDWMGLIDVTYSDIEGGWPDVGDIDADPLFVRSPWAGPDGIFGTADDDVDLHLRAGSPALDVGSNVAIPAGITTDLGGNARIQNDTVDLGAYEGAVAVPAPKTIYVDPNATGANTGASWGNAFTSLTSALQVAADGDSIRIADGTYKPTATTDRTISFALRNNVGVYGGYAGCGAADPDARDVAAYPTILSGDIGTIGSKADNSYHVLTAISVGASSVLDGVTLTRGNASGSGNQGYGGGLFLTGSSPTLTNSIFSGDSAIVGGAVYISSSSPMLTDCVFSGNSAGSSGAMCIDSSTTVLNNCTFSGNVAANIGAIFDTSSSLTLSNCIVWGCGSSPVYTGSVNLPTVIHSDIEGGHTGAGNIDADPLFVRSPWAGSDGLWGTADDDYGDLRLRVGSPALDIGSNAAVPTGTTTDLTGNARIQNGTVDLGAYEGATEAPAAKIIYVDGAAVGGNNGSSWFSAFTSLQSALLVAADGDTIRVADGTYKPTSTSDRTATFSLKSDVGIYGGYAGYGAANPDARNVALHQTVLSGDVGVPGTKTDNSYCVVTALGLSASSILDGLTIAAAYASGNSQNVGGGMCNISSSPTLNNCVFTGNYAVASGGAMYNGSSSPVLTDCSFLANSAGNYGGAIYSLYSSALVLTNSTLIGNLASLRGGGMYIDSSQPTLTNCTFIANLAENYGGAMYTYNASPTLANCIISGNGTAPIYNGLGRGPRITYSDVEGGYPGIGNLDANPMFVRSPWAGPDGAFGTADDDYGDLRLRSGSPALDAGSNAAVPVGTTVDLTGNARIQNGTVDMGAYEGPISGPSPKIIYVDANASGTNTGASWNNAFTSLQPALFEAIDGDSIRVADGTYKPTSTTDRTTTLALRSGVGIYGGYAGCDTANPDARDVALYATVLSGDIGIVGSSTDNSYHVVTADALDSSALLDGVTVTKGSGTMGGGLYVMGSSLTVNNCIILGNSATLGAGIYSGYCSSPMLANCTFSRDSGNAGAGVYSYYSSPTLTNCTFSTNTASSDGGGVYGLFSNLTLTNCTLIGNSARTHGAGVYIGNSTSTMTNCAFSSNSANSYGGGIYSTSSTLTLTNCTISTNTAGNYGGGMYNAYASPSTLKNCTFSGNSAAGDGGAIYNFNSSPALTNCAFSANAASNGGGVYNGNSSSPRLTNCSFSGNTASSGGGMYNPFASSPTLTNCIVWGSGSSPVYSSSSTPVVISYSDIEGGYTGIGNIGADPLFARNPSKGPDGIWGTADDDYGDLRLRSTSPAIDAGNNATSGVAGVTTDLAGMNRFVDVPTVTDTGVGPAPIVDMGAYEFDPPPTVVAFVVNDGSAQRSMVNELVVTFSEPVTLTNGSISVVRRNGSAVPDVAVSANNPNADQKTWELTFSGSGTQNGSLPDGTYRLVVTAAGVSDLAGNAMTGGYTHRFYRLFGDSDGDRIVNRADLAAVRNVLNQPASAASWFDFDGNGTIDVNDLRQLRARLRRTLL